MGLVGKVVIDKGVEGSGHACLARVVNHSDTLITQASLSSIGYVVRNLTTAATAATNTALTISSVVYDTLQTGSGWDQDDAQNLGPDDQYGFNFRAVIPATAFGSGSLFQVDVKFTPSSGEPFIVPFQIDCTETYH